MSEINLKKAPQREILSIDRRGEWGKVEYDHRLSCGHTETRKRPSTAPKIACSWCVIAVAKDEELKSLAVRETVITEVPLDDFVTYDEDALHDVDAGRLRAGLVSALGVPPESVEVVSEVGDDGSLSTSYVVVFMDLSTATRLAGFDNDPHL